MRTYYRTLRKVRETEGPLSVEEAKQFYSGFVDKLQKRYSFRFAKAYRGLEDERNRWIQEALATHFLFGTCASMISMEMTRVNLSWDLAASISKMIGKGGEHFRPSQFNVKQKSQALEIGENHFKAMLQSAEELSLSMRFNSGPVNSAEHVIAWCFRYTWQLLRAAEWESAHLPATPIHATKSAALVS